jgi:hypothetical protein
VFVCVALPDLSSTVQPVALQTPISNLDLLPWAVECPVERHVQPVIQSPRRAFLNLDRSRRSFFGKTQAEAVDKMRVAQRRIDDGLPLLSEDLTVGQYLAEWLEGKKSDLRPETWRAYRKRVTLRLVPTLGRYKLSNSSRFT